MRYIYLHGFGSSGGTSRKADWLRRRFAKRGRELECPDLVPGDFATLTLSGQIRVLEELLAGDSCRLVGSSFGGLVAANFASQHPEVEALVLLAPAFGFPGRWVERLGADGLEEWRENGWLEVYHHAEGRNRDVHYGFYQDALSFPAEPEFGQRAVIVHGRGDETVPVDGSRSFCARIPGTELREVEGGHALDSEEALGVIWEAMEALILAEDG